MNQDQNAEKQQSPSLPPPLPRKSSRRVSSNFTSPTPSVCEKLQPSTAMQNIQPSKAASIILIVHIFLVYLVTSLSTGLLTIGVPDISVDINLDQDLLYWPVFIYSLTSAAFLLFAGAVADVVGRQVLNILSLFWLSVFAFTCGLSKTGMQLIVFRALGGIALAFFLPTSMSLISTNITKGTLRNIGFALIAVGQIVGFSLGLVLGGVFVSTIGWRAGYYICGGVLMALFISAFWILPSDRYLQNRSDPLIHELRTKIDWIGLLFASSALATLAYVLAQLTTSASNINRLPNILLLVLSFTLIVISVVWFQYQENNKRPALIPNSLWRNTPFSAICIMVILAYAEMQTMELLSSLFFQKVQGLSAIQASIRILPSLIVAAVLEFLTGALVHRFPAVWLVLITSAIGAVSPLLMALIQPSWPYWWAAFPAQILFPLCADVLFTVALLVISEVFPEKDQALAGAVFNVMSQFGQALGLAIIGVISNAVTQADSRSENAEDASPSSLMKGYRAGFFTAFAWIVLLCIIGAVGLRSVGKVGLAKEENDSQKRTTSAGEV